jgi:DNA uptake protein ComE-like DNA-binding protein
MVVASTIIASGISMAQGISKPAIRTRPSPTYPTGPITITDDLDLNSASQRDLMRLLDVDAAQAKQIIEGRPYKQTSELVSRKIIPASIYEKIKDKVTVKGTAK